MMNYIFGLFDALMTTRLWSRDAQRDRVVPPTGYTATLTLFSSAVMAFLSVFALTLSISASRLSVYWGDALANSSTLQISARADQMETQVALALQILKTTSGIEAARVISYEEQQKLLEPWFGPAAPLQRLSLPTLIDITEAASGYNVENLRLRLAADVPGAILDDHAAGGGPGTGGQYTVGDWIVLCIADLKCKRGHDHSCGARFYVGQFPSHRSFAHDWSA